MSLSTVLEVTIGLSFVFFVLSLVCSGVSEFLASVLRLRSKTLHRALTEMLGSRKHPDELFCHAPSGRSTAGIAARPTSPPRSSPWPCSIGT